MEIMTHPLSSHFFDRQVACVRTYARLPHFRFMYFFTCAKKRNEFGFARKYCMYSSANVLIVVGVPTCQRIRNEEENNQ